jgi:hypothetical protein
MNMLAIHFSLKLALNECHSKRRLVRFTVHHTYPSQLFYSIYKNVSNFKPLHDTCNCDAWRVFNLNEYAVRYDAIVCMLQYIVVVVRIVVLFIQLDRCIFIQKRILITSSRPFGLFGTTMSFNRDLNWCFTPLYCTMDLRLKPFFK